MSKISLGNRFLTVGRKLDDANAHRVLEGFLFWLANTSGYVHYQKGKILDELLRLIAATEGESK